MSVARPHGKTVASAGRHRFAGVAVIAAAVGQTAHAHDAVLAARLFADLSDRAYQCEVYARVAAPGSRAKFTDAALRFGAEEAFAVREALADPLLRDKDDTIPDGTWHGPQLFTKSDLPSLSAIQRADKLIQKAEAELVAPQDMAPNDRSAHRFAVATQRFDELGCEGLLK